METLHKAAADGDVAALRQLIAAGADVNQPDVLGFLALHHAVFRGHIEALQLLLAAAADPVALGGSHLSPLDAALSLRDDEAALLMLEAAPAAASAPGADGCFPIHAASGGGMLATVRRLLQLAPETAAAPASSTQPTPLHRAARCGHPKVVELLLAAAPHTALTPASSIPGSPLPFVDTLSVARLWFPYGEHKGTIQAACLLLPHTPPDLALPALHNAGALALPLYADLASHWPLSTAQWKAIPSPCPDLACALPVVLARSAAEAAALVAHLPAADRACLRTAALCLHRSQQQQQVPLPCEVMGRILSLTVV